MNGTFVGNNITDNNKTRYSDEKAISHTERLATKLRFSVTGRSFEDLKFSTAIAPETISSISLETCEAMITFDKAGC